MLSSGVTVSGQGPLIVFLHSSLSSSKQWKKLAGSLSSHFTCINIDLIGYGLAEKVVDKSNFSFDTEISRIMEIVHAVQPNEKFHLIGHSCGGAIALKMAVSIPEQLLSLTMYEPVAFHLLDISSDMRLQLDHFTEQVASLDKDNATKAFVDFWNGDGFFKSLPEKVQGAMSNDIDKVNLDFIGIFHENYGLEALRQLTFPCLVMYGQFTPDVSKNLSESIINNLVNVQSVGVLAGHMGPISHSHLVEPVIAEFLKELL